jgi:hypothetical protein
MTIRRFEEKISRCQLLVVGLKCDRSTRRLLYSLYWDCSKMSVLDLGLTLLCTHSLILDNQGTNHGCLDGALEILYEKRDERLRNVPPTEAIFEINNQ